MNELIAVDPQTFNPYRTISSRYGKKFTDSDGNTLEVRHNHSFGEFHLTVYTDNPGDKEHAGVRLTLEQAIALRNEIDERIKEQTWKPGDAVL